MNQMNNHENRRTDTVLLFRSARFARVIGVISREHFREESRIVVLG